MHHLKPLLKAFLLTLLYLPFIELAALWVIPAELLNLNYLPHYTLIQSIFQLTGILLFLQLSGNLPRTTFTLPKHLFWIPIAVLLGVANVLLQAPLAYVYNQIFPPQPIPQFHTPEFQHLLSSSAVGAVLLIPISEELFFRHFLQRKVSEHHRPVLAIGVVALLFGLMHVSWFTLIAGTGGIHGFLVVAAIFGGLLAGVLYWKSQRALVPILFHVAWNLAATVL